MDWAYNEKRVFIGYFEWWKVKQCKLLKKKKNTIENQCNNFNCEEHSINMFQFTFPLCYYFFG